MALIVEYHVIADMYPVSGNVTAGMCVTLTAAGVVASPAATTGQTILGIAGDSALAAEGQTTAYSANLVIGADGGGTRFTENRVSDFYNETTASQKITVYNGGGKFWVSTDLFDAAAAAAIVVGTFLEPSAAGTAGNWDDAADVNDNAAIAVGAAQAYPSGVPGTDTTDGSITLGDYIPMVLRV